MSFMSISAEPLAPADLLAGKVCLACNQWKSFAGEYYRNRAMRGGVSHYCKPCHNQHTGGWKKRNRARVAASRKVLVTADPLRYRGYKRKHNLKKRFGLTPEGYEALLASQGNACAICAVPANVSKKRLAVDHCHETGAVRGLLCGNCNTLLGKAKDDPAVLSAAIAYLQRGDR